MPDVALALSGLNNRASDFKMPKGKARNAVNVDFNTDGSLSFPRTGYTEIIAGQSTKSLFDTGSELLFVDDGYLKSYADGTTKSLVAVADAEMSYAQVADTVYYSNGTDFGKYEAGVIKNWGISPPTVNPKATATVGGGMFAGTYRVSITWLSEIGSGKYEESAMTQVTVLDVAENGGIYLSEFPSAPSYVQKVAVYVSGVNGADLYLYGQYPCSSGMAVSISKVYDAIKARNMFCMRVSPKRGLRAHNGRIYWIDGPFVRYTQPHEYGIYHPNAFLWFEEPITNIISLNRLLFITTTSAIYRVDGIDISEEPAPLLSRVKNYGAAAGMVCYDEFFNNAFVLSHRGFVVITNVGEMQELAFDHVATPKFMSGTLTLIYNKGSRRLVAVGKGGTVSPLQDSVLTTTEITRKGNAL